MWEIARCGRMAEREKQAKRYPTDLTDAEWEIVRPLLSAPPKRGRKLTTDLREVLNALRYGVMI